VGVGFHGQPISLDDLLFRGHWPEPRGESPNDEQVQRQQGEEQHAEDQPEDDLRPEHLPEDAREVDLAEPEAVDVEAGPRREEDEQQHEPADDEQYPSAASDRGYLRHAPSSSGTVKRTPAPRSRRPIIRGFAGTGRPARRWTPEQP